MSNLFNKTNFLFRVSLRRDWLKLCLWFAIIVILMTTIAYKFTDMYGTTAEINSIMPTLREGSMVAMFGTFSYPLNSIDTAHVFANEMTLFMAIVMIVLNIAITVKATRSEEDSGLTELLRAKSTGKLASLAASTWEIFLYNLVIGVLLSLGLYFANMNGSELTGDFLLGLSLGVVGFMFGAIAMVMAQISDHSSGATMWSYLIFGIFYIVRMMTDVQNPSYTWWSPLGWIEKTSAYQDNNWLPLIYMLILSMVLVILAFFLNQHRDTGSGLVATHSGRRTASRFLRGPISLGWRLNRTIIISWFIGVAALGASYGSIFKNIGQILKSNSTMQQVFTKGASNAASHQILLNFIAIISIIIVIVSSIPSVQLMLKLKSDEGKGWLELLHAKPLSRTRLYLSYYLISAISGILLWFVGIGSLIVTGNSVLDSANQLSYDLLWSSFAAFIPALLIMIGITAVIVGFIPRFGSAMWLYIVYAVVAMYLGNLVDMPNWAKQFTPFAWVPKVPLKDFNGVTFSWMLIVAAILLVVGLYGYRRRDLK
ncbi:ABC transporter permease [Secundilactobacillus malefermentans]|uniref:ABC transporter permease n=1 Tax=Secundilactobacillus malefermentans TaxID=176292 RepID=A0A4R5NRD9_9LACO|nr:exporter of polyketide antibiotics [Secundilactobacillus malefermentans]QEA31612.1 ABC transporter permease [Secundilactobacillus malefermentans]TDG78965.1 hypothetical protein C5L31_000560 [Secundilactobacillus malefermentans]